ncbi:MAG TPA: AzlD domain-containing protein [Actinomycetota bacterium]|jgi:branched-subunit amino acid transport protein|nr:AzlD domain-containing protein [Actinomycetota bacterium]
MSEAWLVVVTVGGATMAMKALGPVLLGGRDLPRPVAAAIRLLAPAVLAALVVVQAVGGDREIVVDERLVGLGAAFIALLLRAPLVVVVVVAAGSTALLRVLL